MPRKQPPVDAAERIEALAADGFSMVGVAKRLGTTFDVLTRWMEERPALRAAFDRGREDERYALHNFLYRQAMEMGHAPSAMFLLKARHGYREGEPVEVTNNVRLSFTLPTAMTLDQFRGAIDAETSPPVKRLPASPARRSRRT
jgi:hypothetical protein